jgi:vancomycin resistance protein YoaR
VRKLAAQIAERLLAHPVVVRHAAKSERATVGRLGGRVGATAAVEAALAPPPEPASFIDRVRARFAPPEPRDIPLPLSIDARAAERALARFSIRVGIEPREPRLTKQGGRFRILPARPGRELDVDAVARLLQAAADDPAFRATVAASLAEEDRAVWLAGCRPLEIDAPTRPARPRVTAEHLARITATLATFSTGLGASSRNRVGNIAIACRAIDGTVLLPGDLFSYNDVVGPRVPSAGYKRAPVIINGEMENGLAGGICQVSSTLYNAALLADLNIVTRRRHAFPVSYLPAGRDATVVDGAIDLRFRNSLEHPIAIDAKVVGRRVVLAVYGHPDDRREVSVLASGLARVPAGIRTVTDANLPEGRRVTEKAPRSGRRVTVTRVVKRDGRLLRREVVSRDYYPPQAGVVRVGAQVEPKPADPGAPKPAGAVIPPHTADPKPPAAARAR